MRRIALALAAATLALGAAACGGEEETGSAAAADKPLVVGASPVPHAEILNFIKDNLAEKNGLELEVKEFTDYVLPNTALVDGQLDANYFQTPAYLADQEKARNFKATSIVGVHIEPLGLYSREIEDVASVPNGAQVAIPNDATNEARALRLLAANNLITLKPEATETATIRDIQDNPKKLEFAEVEAAQTPRSLDDADLAVINGNYALEADLTPSEDALALEQAQNNPNANLLVTLPEERNDPRVKKLAQLLTSPEVKQFIDQQYKGAVLPAF
ncbi:MetQ/NlpA family ABC transporter substrate-binding protein [Solirubrobacter sp. CPCC 204708]|uniref:Lipoprotein n=1 Tax=Solirubrobacter deserti TaxID=2282478 RepID=A0ABT4RL40_9ACTN|nr:MetQ/NlpA family ABC transporter substrate-binding protein [Solirubrobacter deserti]MBE2319029.1 MetQ/NlpA family ABC transporter substrate-binding protein [Solirubrobacter deserti]MDA0139247.1 MetQ/NlpA family ABC transporter substrate-binding protein [Solirubrobacter deserti]